jgi:integrase/recombinase XerD
MTVDGGIGELAAKVDDYLALRRSLGDKLDNQPPLLRELAGRLDAAHTGGTSGTPVTVEAILAWASAPGRSGPRTRKQVSQRLTVARGFTSYLSAFDPTVQVPPRNLIPPQVIRPTPMIFTAQQVTALMDATGTLQPVIWSATLRTLIGLMAATGLRTGEVFRLSPDDVDLGQATVAVLHSKYGKSRTLPLHPSTLGPLTDYAALRKRHHRSAVTFLVDGNGRSLGAGNAVGATFNRLLGQAGIVAPQGQLAPRLHNLRHTFAVATLRDWHLSLVDTQPRLAELSAYLGHVNPRHTYWYLQAVPELLAPVAIRLEAHLGLATETNQQGPS